MSVLTLTDLYFKRQYICCFCLKTCTGKEISPSLNLFTGRTCTEMCRNISKRVNRSIMYYRMAQKEQGQCVIGFYVDLGRGL